MRHLMLNNSDEDTIVEYSYKGHGWKIEEYSNYSSRGDKTAEIDDLNTQSLETVNLWTDAGGAWPDWNSAMCWILNKRRV